MGYDPEVLHESEHVLTEFLVVLVDGSTVFRRVALSGFVDSSEDVAEQFFSEDDERCNGRDGLLRNSVSAGVRKLADQAFAAELFDVVSGATRVIVGSPRCGANSVC